MSIDRPPIPRGGERFGAWFDAAAADAACAFFPTYLRHTEAEWAGRPFELQRWQRDDVIRPLFGWKRADGTRLYRQCYLEVGRKNGKTELAAGVALLALLGDGEYGGQGYSAAVDKDQAKIVFHKAGVMVGLSEQLAEQIEVFKTSLYCAELMASFKPLSSTPASKHGFSPSVAVADEVHEWPSGELQDVIHKGMAARRQPLEFFTTTAGQLGRGYGWELHRYALQVRDGIIEDPTFLPVIYAADEDDDWTDERTWAKANPNLGVSIKLDFLRAEFAKARLLPRLENEFKRYHLNLWTEQQTRWLPLEDWDACSADPGDPDRWRALEAELAGRECWGGLDLASTRDITALVWLFPPDDRDDPAARWPVLWRFWVPAANVRTRFEQDRVPYADWARAGALSLTEGNVTDYRVIKAQVAADAERFQVRELAIDRWNASQVAVELADEGITIAMFGQGFASMGAPTKELERLVMGHRLEHGNHPVARWMAGNACVVQDPAGNIKPAKDKSSEKIDGIVAAIMALGRATVAEAPAAPLEIGADYEVVAL